MSISIGGTIRSTVSLRQIGEVFASRRQDAIREAERVGVEYLKEHTPVDTGDLQLTADSHENQYAVWFTLAGILNGKPYGFAQEYGWHMRNGEFHEGIHMVENTMAVAASAFIGVMGGGGNPITYTHPMVNDYFPGGGSGGGVAL